MSRSIEANGRKTTPLSGSRVGDGAGTFRAYYTVVVLTLVYCFAFVDRQIFNLLVAPIKRDFGVSDVELGYLLGPAFILSYVALGLPAGWCVDRFNRRNLIMCAGVCWSLGTMAGAFAQSYAGLFGSRLLVGASEALIFPAGFSFIADLFDRRRLPLATSIFILAPSIGSGLALTGGGLLLQYTEQFEWVTIPLLGRIHGWQATLLVIGIIGLAPVLLLTTIRDAARQAKASKQTEPQFGFLEGTRHMLTKGRFYAAFFFGMAFSSMVMLTIGAWAPTYLSRTFALSPAEVGTRYGPLVLLFGLAGGIASPVLNAWLGRRYPLDSTMRTVILGPAMIIPLALILLLAKSQSIALVCLALLTFTYNFPLSMASASLQLVTPARLRGAASAWYFVIGSLIGYGIGPTAVPIVAKSILHDPSRIGFAMASVAALFAAIALILCIVAHSGFRRERLLQSRYSL